MTLEEYGALTLEEYGALTLEEYGALIERTGELADRLAAIEAAGDPRVPHEVALAIIGGEHPVRAFRNHQELTLRELSGRSGVALSYLSETEHGRKPGSVAALTRIAAAFWIHHRRPRDR